MPKMDYQKDDIITDEIEWVDDPQPEPTLGEWRVACAASQQWADDSRRKADRRRKLIFWTFAAVVLVAILAVTWLLVKTDVL